LDELLSEGFEKDLGHILTKINPHQKIAVTSTHTEEATLKMMGRSKYELVRIGENPKPLIRQEKINCAANERLDRLLQILRDHSKSIIFVNTKKTCRSIREALTNTGKVVDFLNGDLTARNRKVVTERFRNGDIDYLVATDLAARGLDFPELPLVVNYDMPLDQRTYTHRIGRTGRNGREGVAITFIIPATSLRRKNSSVIRRGAMGRSPKKFSKF